MLTLSMFRQLVKKFEVGKISVEFFTNLDYSIRLA